ncbi:S-4TM family putative pore-forming effector [Bacillus mycoides]|uniref:S-4TM family putative pore-forming effector n=1 Tax=Bacillus mycoides TaxID=1405 RepID=UPI0028531FA4|nr:S-4TM family putative pore-forming effector [Bacillus mycoides]MDR4900748.1 S-4TM family putative pore-forming effector [Bacillus mycoides]
MSTINERQNDERNFRLKICFRHLYDRAKVIYNVHLAVSLIIPIIALSAKTLELEYKDIILSISSCWIIIAMLLTIWEQKIRLKAVTLQERYDINVLGLKENETIMYKKVSIEEISLIVKKMKQGKNIDRIYYDGIECSNNTKALLLAQRQNVLSDKILRGKYCLFFWVLLISIVLFSIVVGIMLNQTVKGFLIEILIPLISLISFIIQQIKKLSEEVKRNEQIGGLIERDIRELNGSEKEIEISYLVKCREYQNYIFTKRLNGALIPNFIYRMFKNNYVNGKEINQSLTSEAGNIQ